MYLYHPLVLNKNGRLGLHHFWERKADQFQKSKRGKIDPQTGLITTVTTSQATGRQAGRQANMLYHLGR